VQYPLKLCRIKLRPDMLWDRPTWVASRASHLGCMSGQGFQWKNSDHRLVQSGMVPLSLEQHGPNSANWFGTVGNPMPDNSGNGYGAVARHCSSLEREGLYCPWPDFRGSSERSPPTGADDGRWEALD
jgi:hypothetical protein